ncbi:MAG TPA: class I SAM-dependent methyltransferase [Microthrixaceae bacterium]|nr:class I SAM-dependent methyltransferase [Microthrixaceae bacterium]
MGSTEVSTNSAPLPGDALDASRMPGHWLLARLGKKVLRPGGREMTEQILSGLAIGPSDDVVEVAPGLGATTRLVLAAHPASYTGVDRDPDAAGLVGNLLDGPNRRVIHASAQDTGLASDSADVVFGEAYLTMQPDSLKHKVVAELARVLRPGGRFALHEVAFSPDDITDAARDHAAAALTSTIKVNVTPMTVTGWTDLLADHGLIVQSRFRSPLHLLEPRRLIADEGLTGAARFVFNVLRDRDARTRVTAMRSAMRTNAAHLQAYGLVAVKSATPTS